MERKIICALDTGDVAFKIGHALTLRNGLGVIDSIREAGASRVFLDLKFHDIPNSVALAVREAVKFGVWMMTVHIAGGPAMMSAAAEEAQNCGLAQPPLLVGVSVLTSLDQHVLTQHLGVKRDLTEHMVYLSRWAVDCGLDGVVCSALEVKPIRQELGHNGIIITPGIRVPQGVVDDQVRVGQAQQALSDGANYLVVGRALMSSEDPENAMRSLGFEVGRQDL